MSLRPRPNESLRAHRVRRIIARAGTDFSTSRAIICMRRSQTSRKRHEQPEWAGCLAHAAAIRLLNSATQLHRHGISAGVLGDPTEILNDSKAARGRGNDQRARQPRRFRRTLRVGYLRAETGSFVAGFAVLMCCAIAARVLMLTSAAQSHGPKSVTSS